MSNLMVPEKLKVKIRGGLIKDIKNILDLDKDYDSITDTELKKFKKEEGSLILVAEFNAYVVGFLLARLLEEKIRLLNLVVIKELRRHEIGTQMVQHIERGFLKKERHTIFTEVNERNLGGQLFLKALGFRATNTYKGFYGTDDAILMEYVPVIYG